MNKAVLVIILSLIFTQIAGAQLFLNAFGRYDSEAYKEHMMQRYQNRQTGQKWYPSRHTPATGAHKPASGSERLKYMVNHFIDDYYLHQTDSTVFIYNGNQGSAFDYDVLDYHLIEDLFILGISNSFGHDFLHVPLVKFDTAYVFSTRSNRPLDTFYIRYSPEGNPVEQKMRNWFYSHTYNSRSLVTSITIFDLDAGDSVSKYDYEYNGDNQISTWTAVSNLYGWLEPIFKEEYRYATPSAYLPSQVIRFQRDFNTLNEWILIDSISIISVTNSKSHTRTFYDKVTTGGWEGPRWIHSYTYDGDQQTSFLWLDGSSGSPTMNDTTSYGERTLNSDKLPVQSIVRSFYYYIWDTSVYDIKYNANNNPVSVNMLATSGWVIDRKYGYESYIASAIGSTEIPAAALAIYPNPARQTLYITTGAIAPGDISIRIVNTLGQQIHYTSVSVPDNSGTITLPLEKIPPGHYQVCVTDTTGKRHYAGFVKI